MLPALVVGVLSFPAYADAKARCHSKRCHERVHRKKCSQSRPRHCVERAILTYKLNGWQASWMRRVPGCESGWNWASHNASGASGLFQFMPGTWASTRYARHSIWSNKWQALAAASFIRAGQAHQWVCK